MQPPVGDVPTKLGIGRLARIWGGAQEENWSLVMQVGDVIWVGFARWGLNEEGRTVGGWMRIGKEVVN